MPDKLTDAEIVKALECCIKTRTLADCKNSGCPALITHGCSYYLGTDDDFEGVIFVELIKDALDLINRLQAENTELLGKIEKLEKENKCYAELEQGCYVTGYKNIKAEAYKECIEKVKALFPSYNEPYQYWEIHEGADNILKELVGDE